MADPHPGCRDTIWNPKTGERLAFVDHDDGKIYDNATNTHVANYQSEGIFSLQGELLGHLGTLHFAPAEQGAVPQGFLKVLGKVADATRRSIGGSVEQANSLAAAARRRGAPATGGTGLAIGWSITVGIGLIGATRTYLNVVRPRETRRQ